MTMVTTPTSAADFSDPSAVVVTDGGGAEVFSPPCTCRTSTGHISACMSSRDARKLIPNTHGCAFDLVTHRLLAGRGVLVLAPQRLRGWRASVLARLAHLSMQKQHGSHELLHVEH